MNFLHAMVVLGLGYLPKLKRDLELAFDGHFLHDFCIKKFFIQYSQWTKFQCDNFFPSEDIKQKVLSSYLDS